jgi:hypothetical protein
MTEIDLIRHLEKIVNENEFCNGHLTIMKFTSCWKIMCYTPNLDSGDGRDQVRAVHGYLTLREALVAEVLNQTIINPADGTD